MDTREVIETYYDSVNRGNCDIWPRSLTRNRHGRALGRHIEVIGTLRGAIDGLKKGYSRFENRPRRIVVEGDQAAVVSHISAANAAGDPIEAEVATYFQIQNGRIMYMATLHDSVLLRHF